LPSNDLASLIITIVKRNVVTFRVILEIIVAYIRVVYTELVRG
jgi:hypothetical protein